MRAYEILLLLLDTPPESKRGNTYEHRKEGKRHFPQLSPLPTIVGDPAICFHDKQHSHTPLIAHPSSEGAVLWAPCLLLVLGHASHQASEVCHKQGLMAPWPKMITRNRAVIVGQNEKP